MTRKVFLVLKSFFLGVANLIPVISGGTLIVTFGIYEYVLDAIDNIFKNFKDSINKLMPIVIGMFLALISMSKVISYTLDKYQFQTIMFFIGLVIGGIPLLFDKIKGKSVKKNIIWFILTFILILVSFFLKIPNQQITFKDLNIINYLLLIVIGMISFITIIAPGISFSSMLILMGYYKPIIDTLNDINNVNHLGSNLLILLPFGIGCLTGIILFAKLIKMLLEKYEVKFYYGIIGLVLSSIMGMILEINSFKPTFFSILLGIITFFWGFFVTKALLNENK